MEVLLVEGVTAALPATPVSDWDDVHEYKDKLPRARRYQNYVDTQFRPIRAAFEANI